jgi:hypothetical protein
MAFVAKHRGQHWPLEELDGLQLLRGVPSQLTAKQQGRQDMPASTSGHEHRKKAQVASQVTLTN